MNSRNHKCGKPTNDRPASKTTCRAALLSTCIALTGVCDIAAATDSNLLPNGDFSNTSHLNGWSDMGPGEMMFDYADDSNHDFDSGSMVISMSNMAGPSTVASSCFTVMPGANYNYGGQFSSDDDSASSELRFTCSSFDNSNCTGSAHGMAPLVVNSVDVRSSSHAFSGPMTTSGVLSGTSKSVLCNLSMRATSSGFMMGNTSMRADNLFFNSQSPTVSMSPMTVGGYMSGNWYDPTQGGQGFQLEFTEQNDTMLAIWFVYTPDGSGQNWIYAQGPYDLSKSSVTLPAEILTGGKFPPLFKSTDVHATPWGTITFTFTDCDHGTAAWNSSMPGYGSGSMPIGRLTQVRGTTCPR